MDIQVRGVVVVLSNLLFYAFLSDNTKIIREIAPKGGGIVQHISGFFLHFMAFFELYHLQ